MARAATVHANAAFSAAFEHLCSAAKRAQTCRASAAECGAALYAPTVCGARGSCCAREGEGDPGAGVCVLADESAPSGRSRDVYVGAAYRDEVQESKTNGTHNVSAGWQNIALGKR